MYGPLQDMCGADHWSVSLIDLRQTASEDSDPRMLAAAMQAIEACRVGAFVCLLGAKYGHVLTAVPAESARSLESKPWLAAVRNECLPEAAAGQLAASMLELECTSAFMLAPAEMPGAFFYFRDEACAGGVVQAAPAGARARGAAGDDTAMQSIHSEEFYDVVEYRQQRSRALASLKVLALREREREREREAEIGGRGGSERARQRVRTATDEGRRVKGALIRHQRRGKCGRLHDAAHLGRETAQEPPAGLPGLPS